jgi:hypothetical protein
MMDKEGLSDEMGVRGGPMLDQAHTSTDHEANLPLFLSSKQGKTLACEWLHLPALGTDVA